MDFDPILCDEVSFVCFYPTQNDPDLTSQNFLCPSSILQSCCQSFFQIELHRKEFSKESVMEIENILKGDQEGLKEGQENLKGDKKKI